MGEQTYRLKETTPCVRAQGARDGPPLKPRGPCAPVAFVTRLPGWVLLAVVVVACAVAAPVARANGDPASDYLITLPVFLPFESAVSEESAQELKQLLATAKDKGFEVRVALIASPRDLGAVPVLYRKPQRYANFLGQELVYYYKGVLLVVMPNGFGVFKNGDELSKEKTLLARLAPPGTTDGNALATSAQNAVRTLARARGVTLPTAAAESSSSSNNRNRVVIVVGAILLSAVAFGARRLLGRRNGDPDPA